MSETKMPASGLTKKIILIVLVTATVIAVGFGIARYIADRIYYERGHQAYMQSDCGMAIDSLDKVIGGWRLFDIGGYERMSQQERDECQDFQEAFLLESGGDPGSALIAYLDFMNGHANSHLVQAARARASGQFQAEKIPVLASEASCKRTGELIASNLIPEQETNLPLFYLGCARMYERINQPGFAFALYQWLMSSYPENPASSEAETSLLEGLLACEESETLRQSVIANRTDFMPRLYHHCGRLYEQTENYADARKMYETFLAYHPEHTLAAEVEASLARTIVAQAAASGAGEIAQPDSSGSTASGEAQIVIQNDSPDRLRITFSGPSSRVEELDSCPTCTAYDIGQEPLYCPELGPIGQYALPPGSYDIVVESISDNEVTPWIGHWSLADGNAYYRCILLASTAQ